MTTMGSNLPAWVTPVAWVFLILAVLSAVAILTDVYLLGHRQPSRGMEIVWPVTALYLGPFVMWAYVRWGRPAAASATRARGAQAGSTTSSASTTSAASTTPATSTVAFGLPGGAASVLAHIVGVPLVALTGWTIAGLDMWAMIAVIAVVALAILFAFEYRSRASATARLAAPSSTARTALIVAVATILAFDIGMVGWMVVLHIGVLMPPISEVSFVFLMQIGVVIGLGTAYPVISHFAHRSARPVVGSGEVA